MHENNWLGAIVVIRVKLREVAQERGISQSKLMRKADVDIRTIQRLYRDPYTNITLATLEKLAVALECDICDLLVRET
jgi:DNA-binding Xre family transcriptional regulator